MIRSKIRLYYDLQGKCEPFSSQCSFLIPLKTSDSFLFDSPENIRQFSFWFPCKHQTVFFLIPLKTSDSFLMFLFDSPENIRQFSDVSFWFPWKHQTVFWCFRGYHKGTSVRRKLRKIRKYAATIKNDSLVKI